jgi:hypothetical protein
MPFNYDRAAAIVAAHSSFVSAHNRAVDSCNRRARLQTERAITKEMLRIDKIRASSINDVLEQFENSNKQCGPAILLDSDNPYSGRILAASRVLNRPK